MEAIGLESIGLESTGLEGGDWISLESINHPRLNNTVFILGIGEELGR